MRASTYDDLACAIEGVLRHIQSHLDEPHDVLGLAEYAGYSPYHFQRAFRKLVGESPMEHVRRIRLERAAFQLRTTSQSVSLIAIDAGFDSIAGFSRAFESAFSAPPTLYRSSPWLMFWQTAACGVHFDPVGNFVFEPLEREGFVSEAKVMEVAATPVLALAHEGPVNYLHSWQKLRELLDAFGVDYSGSSFYAFTHEPKRPRQTWKIRGFVSVDAELQVAILNPLERHVIGGGRYLVKRFTGAPPGIGDFWARAWHQDLKQLGVRPRNGCAYNHMVKGLTVTGYDPVVTVDIYLPVH